MFYLNPEQKGEGRELVWFRDELDSLFSRSTELPAEMESTDVAATYKKGVLTVVLKKVNSATAKKIKASTS